MPRQNRVTPLGELVATSERGLVYGNRGCLHDELGRIRRRYAGRRWIACRLEFRGRRRTPLLQPGRYTELFFLDDATALAAGHRPCAECRREDYDRFVALWRRPPPGSEPGGRDRRAAPRGTRRPDEPRPASTRGAVRRAPRWRLRAPPRRGAARAGTEPAALDARRLLGPRAQTDGGASGGGHPAVPPLAATRRLAAAPRPAPAPVGALTAEPLAAGWGAGHPAPHPWHVYRNRMARLL